jgi:hypothetical protein
MATTWGDAADIADRENAPPETDDARAARWDAFVTWCKGDRVKTMSEWSTLLHYVYQNMRDHGDWHHQAINETILTFADAEGWDGVLRAIARGMHEQWG